MSQDRPTPVDEEIILDDKRYIVSKTDAKGIITYGNPYFVQISGYSLDEMLGKPHNIIRHPDMPRVIFRMMWDRISKGENIVAIVKNMAKSGKYYWVMTEFEPKRDEHGDIIEHTAYRKAAPKKAVEAMIPLYSKLLEIEKLTGSMDASFDCLKDFLGSKKLTYDEYISSLVDDKQFKNFFVSIKKIFRSKNPREDI